MNKLKLMCGVKDNIENNLEDIILLIEKIVHYKSTQQFHTKSIVICEWIKEKQSLKWI